MMNEFSLRLFGGVSLEGGDGPVTGAAVQRHRLALLALLGASRPRILTRDKAMGWLWAERDAEHARALLNQAVHVLRRTLGSEAILSAGEDLQLNPALVSCDVNDFEQAAAAGDLEQAAGLYRGPFLDGFFLSDAPEFERWAELERERLASSWAGVVEALAGKAERDRDWRRAADWWRRRVGQDPYDSRAVAHLMLALEAGGNRAAALLQADTHQRLLQEEMGIEPSLEVQSLAQRLRSSTAATGRGLPSPADASYVSSAAGAVPEPSSPAAAAQPSPSSRGAAPAQRILGYGGWVLVGVAAVLLAVRILTAPARSGPTGESAALPVDLIAKAVARELSRREQGDTGARQPPERTRSIAAYELYLRGIDPTLLRNDSTALQGLEYLRRAVALDSNYAAAWAGLARMTLRTGFGGNRSSSAEARAIAERAARRAVALDDSLAEAHAALALVQAVEFDLAAAEASLRKAIALEPGRALSHELLAKVLTWRGQGVEALEETRRSLQLTPLSPTSNAEEARALLVNGRCEEALIQLKKLAGLEPPLARVPGITAQCYARQGKWAEAVAVMRPQAEAGFPNSMGLYGYALARGGQRDAAARVLDTLLQRERESGEASWPIALVFFGLGDLDQAVTWLTRSVDARGVAPVSEHAPLLIALLDSLQGDRRIARLRERMGIQKR